MVAQYTRVLFMLVSCSRRQMMATAGAALALARPRIAHAAVRTLRLGHGNPDDGLFGEGSRAFAAAVAADPILGGTVQISVHGNGALGDELTLMKSCMDGTVDLALCSNVVTGNLVEQVDMLYAPFLFASVAAGRSALDGAIGAELAALMQKRGLHVLAWGENGMRYIGSDRPVSHPADLHGLKIRVPQSEVMIGGFRALGAEPGKRSFSGLREALRTGQFQALENAIATFEASKLYEMTKILSMTGHCYDSIVLVASPDVIEDLTPPQVQALTACGIKAAEVTRHLATVAKEDGVKRLAALGMTVISDVDVPAFREASRAYTGSLAVGDNAPFVKRLIAAAG
jgi:TRAP-type C4-dicarboxylate transport system substrate-binding protein